MGAGNMKPLDMGFLRPGLESCWAKGQLDPGERMPMPVAANFKCT